MTQPVGGEVPLPSSTHAPGLQRWRAAVVAVTAIAGIAVTVVVGQQAEDEAQDRQDVLAAEVALLVEGRAASTVAAIAGGGGLVSPQGGIEMESFRAYADEVVARSPIETLALVAVVPHDLRARFEETIDGAIQDQSDGVLVPASERPVYFPVSAIAPETEQTEPVRGFDILADSVRGTAAIDARDSGRTVLTEPIRTAGERTVASFVVKPLYRAGEPQSTTAQRRDAHVGFLATVYEGADLVATVSAELPSGSRFTVRDGDHVLAASAEPPTRGTTRTVDAAGRRWVLVVEDGRGVDRGLQASVAAFAVLLVAGLALFFRRVEAHDRATRRSATVIARTADVAQALSAAVTVDDVDAVIQEQLSRVLDAKAASLGAVDRTKGVLRLGRSTGANPGIDDPSAEIPLDQRRPVTEAVRLGRPLMLRSLDDWREHAPPELVDEVIRSGLVSTAVLPLVDEDGQVTATLSISWDHEVDFDAPTLDTLRTLTRLCEYTLDRARATDHAAHVATQLAHLAAQLAAAVTVAEVLDIVVESAGDPVGATATSVGLVDREAGLLRTHHGPDVTEDVRHRYTDPPLDAPLVFTEAARTGQTVLLEDHDAFVARYPESAGATTALGLGARAGLPIRDSEGKVVGSLVHAWAGPQAFHEALVSRLLTIAEMAGQALERTGLSEAEHRLVTTLQDSVLVALPPAADLDIAARYLPAAQDIGMGGDWYEGVSLGEHRYALILGDVAGHGITAVGDMAQLRAVIGALVRLGTPARHVFAQTTDLLQAAAHTPTASALLLIVDTDHATATYATAGHPPPLLRRPATATEVLDHARQPILGIPVSDADSAEVPFPVGSVLVAYTDGLIEQRGEPIDVSLQRLRARVDAADPDQGAEALADALLRDCLGDREPADDVALLVIRHRPH